ncbi:MAG TPA: polysaccharide deacetylase family protein [Terriglobales bacterium]|nr:polysaccharide deacetylase family protein [Terriglobales bacterium]
MARVAQYQQLGSQESTPQPALADPRAATVFLMYHELEIPGRPLCQREPGYVRYVLPVADFNRQMTFLKDNGWEGVAVTKALEFGPRRVALTFDDGCETDLLTAAPILRQNGFGATFYITAGFVGERGYLSSAQLQELSAQGFEIGCHSMTHAYLSDLDETGLRRELIDSKKLLEDWIGKSVDHFSCPGGRISSEALAVAREAGYRTVATSRTHANRASTDRFGLGRIAMIRGTSEHDFERICNAIGLWRLSAANLVRDGAKGILGNALYDRLRGAILRT